MILSGDEVRRTQKGNNNAYCQDNETSWFDWNLPKKHGDLFRFWKLMIDFRKRHAAVHRSRFFDGQVNEHGLPDVSWHGCHLLHPGWDDPNARALAFTLAGSGAEADIHVILNMDGEGLDFEIPAVKGRHWYLAVDTAQAAPGDIAEPGQERPILGDRIQVQGRSVVALLSR
jgi:glycogen operon protein